MIQLSANYRIIRSDPLNIAIEKYYPARKLNAGPRKGEMSEPRWENSGYYPSIKLALIAGVSRELELLPDAQSILDRLTELEAAISSLNELTLQELNNDDTTKPRE